MARSPRGSARRLNWKVPSRCSTNFVTGASAAKVSFTLGALPRRHMRVITNILFPVDFSASCVAMASYVKRAATLFGANVSLMYVFDPASHNGFELYLIRGSEEIAEE